MEPKKLSSIKYFHSPAIIQNLMQENLQPGTYRARPIEYSASLYNSKWSFKLYIDILQDDGQQDPHRIMHFINPRWMPSLFIAKIVGLLQKDRWLSGITKSEVIRMQEQGLPIKNSFCGDLIGIEIGIHEYNGAFNNEIIDVLPIESIVVSSEEIKEETKQDITQKAELEPLPFNKEDCPF